MKITANTESVEISLEDREIKELGKDQTKYKPVFDAVKKMQTDYIAAKVTAQREATDEMIKKISEANKEVFENTRKIQKKTNRIVTFKNILSNIVRIGVGSAIVYAVINKDELKAKYFKNKK